MKRFCSTCLLYDGMPLFLHRQLAPAPALPVRVGDDGRCSVCALYEKRASRKMIDAELARFEEDDTPIVVLFSGGKDSTAALADARSLGRETHAVLFDNGLIPGDVIEQARAVCERLDVPLTVEREGPDLLALLDGLTLDSITPCDACARGVYRHALRLAERVGARYLVQGTNYFATWEMFPLSTRAFGAYSVIHLPYARGRTAADTRALLAELDVTPRELPGVSSNCSVPGLVQAKLAGELGHVPELEDLALEILVGHISRAEALDVLAARAPEHAALVADADARRPT